jgi:spore coat protein U-like protein
VASTCIVGTSTLAFGSATSAAIQAGNIDATGTVSVNCTTGSAYTIALDAGGGTGATAASRKMTSGTNLLSYTVYTTAARTTVWDATGPGSVTGTGTGALQSISAYGRIFSGQTVPAATYTDTVNVTVTY